MVPQARDGGDERIQVGGLLHAGERRRAGFKVDLYDPPVLGRERAIGTRPVTEVLIDEGTDRRAGLRQRDISLVVALGERCENHWRLGRPGTRHRHRPRSGAGARGSADADRRRRFDGSSRGRFGPGAVPGAPWDEVATDAPHPPTTTTAAATDPTSRRQGPDVDVPKPMRRRWAPPRSAPITPGSALQRCGPWQRATC